METRNIKSDSTTAVGMSLLLQELPNFGFFRTLVETQEKPRSQPRSTMSSRLLSVVVLFALVALVASEATIRRNQVKHQIREQMKKNGEKRSDVSYVQGRKHVANFDEYKNSFKAL